MADEYSRHTLPSVQSFKKLEDIEQRLAYMSAYKSLETGKAPREKARRKLLENYAKVAGWDEESVRTMESAALTPIGGS